MRFSIVRINELPLGRRVLRYGAQGDDVRELQTLLNQAGFYFGPADGLFGLLTVEAVTLMQKALGLKPDGAAGREFYKTLAQHPARSGRIIYSVKKQESLAALSQRFAVRESAWESLSGQGNPQKRIYPGMKLYLPEKKVFLWEDQPLSGEEASLPFTGLICPRWRLQADGEWEFLQKEGTTRAIESCFKTIEAEEPVWEEILKDRRKWGGLMEKIRRLNNPKLVFDLRKVTLATAKYGPLFSKLSNGKTGNNTPGAMAIVGLPLRDVEAENRVWRMNIKRLASFFRYLIFMPAMDWKSATECEAAFQKIPLFFRKLNKMGLAPQSLWVERVGGWIWKGDVSSGTDASRPETIPFREAVLFQEAVPFREAQRIRAMFPKETRNSGVTKLTTVEFLRRGEKNILIYRSGEDWVGFAKQMARSNLAGLVIRNFSDLKEAGPAAIKGSFAVTPGKMM